MQTKASGILAGALLAVTPLVLSAAPPPAPLEGSTTLQADGVVKSIDPAKRSLTVLDAQGGEASFTITDARELAQLRPGGKVHIRMIRNAVITVTEGAEAQNGLAQTAPQDALQKLNAQITAVNHATGVLSLKDANGSAFHIQGREPSAVASLTPGMQVSVTYAQQVSVAVAPAQ